MNIDSVLIAALLFFVFAKYLPLMTIEYLQRIVDPLGDFDFAVGDKRYG